MKFSLEIEMDNAAFDDGDELSRIVKTIGCNLKGCNSQGGDSGTVRDINGNKIGAWEITGSKPLGDDLIVGYVVLDRDGDEIERHADYTDAERSADAMNAEDLENEAEELGLSAEDYRTTARLNGWPYYPVMAVTIGDDFHSPENLITMGDSSYVSRD